MTEQEGLRDESRAVLKHGLLFSEHTQELVSNYHGDELVSVLKEEAKEMVNNADSPEREKKVGLLLVNLGSQLGSPEVEKSGKSILQQWEKKYGR